MKKQFAAFVFMSFWVVSLLAFGATASADQLTMQEGANIDLSVSENGGISTLTISSLDTNTDEKVKVSASDTAGFLENQIVGGTGVTVNSDGSQITISAPPVNVQDSADGVEVTFARESQSALDLNGTSLFIGTTDPTITLAGQTRAVLSKGTIPNTTPALQQVIVDLPSGQLDGEHKLKLSNSQGFSEGFVSLSATAGFTKLCSTQMALEIFLMILQFPITQSRLLAMQRKAPRKASLEERALSSMERAIT